MRRRALDVIQRPRVQAVNYPCPQSSLLLTQLWRAGKVTPDVLSAQCYQFHRGRAGDNDGEGGGDFNGGDDAGGGDNHGVGADGSVDGADGGVEGGDDGHTNHGDDTVRSILCLPNAQYVSGAARRISFQLADPTILSNNPTK